MDGKVFTAQTSDLIVKVADEGIKLGFFADKVLNIDGMMVKMALRLIDHFGDKVIPDEYDPVINSICTKILNKDYDAARIELATLANKKIDIPILDEATEEMVFQSGFVFIMNLISNFLAKVKK